MANELTGISGSNNHELRPSKLPDLSRFKNLDGLLWGATRYSHIRSMHLVNYLVLGLYISNNRLAELLNHVFDGLTNLKALCVSSNPPDGVFTPLASLILLHLKMDCETLPVVYSIVYLGF